MIDTFGASMTGGFTWTTKGLRSSAASVGRELRKSTAVIMEGRGKSIVKTLMDITPPAGSGVTGSAAVQRGVAAIRRDLLQGNDIEGPGIFKTASASMIARNAKVAPNGVQIQSFVTKDGRVYGVDRAHFRPAAGVAEMREHHRKHFRGGRITRARSNTRDIGRWVFVDKLVVSPSAFERYLVSRTPDVGTLAGGWAAGARRFGVPVPPWIADHPGPGSAEFIVSAGVIVIRLTNRVSYASRVRDLERRVQFTLMVEKHKLDRQLEHILASIAKKAGLRS